MEQGDRNLNNTPAYQCTKRRDPSAFIKKIITYCEHQVTRDDIDRQIEMVTEFIKMCHTGFFVKDLFNIMNLIEILVNKINEISDYVNLLEDILHICSIPPILTVSSDVLSFVRDLQEYFSSLGYLLVCLKTESFQNLVTHTIISLLTMDLSDQRWYLPLRDRKKSAENSRLPEILGRMLEIGDDKVYPKILEIVSLLAKDSDITCKILIDQNALNILLTRIEPTWRQRYPDKKPSSQPINNILYYEDVSCIIWMLLKYLNKNKYDMKSIQNISLFSLWNVRYVYRLFAANKYKYLDRNNILSIMIKLLDFFPNMAFIQSGFGEEILTFDFSPLIMKTVWMSDLQQSLEQDDYTYMQLQLNCIPYYLNFVGGVTVLENFKIVRRLLVIFPRDGLSVIHWPVGQMCTLILMVLDVFGKIVPYLEEDFVENIGPNRLLYLVEKYQALDYDQTVLMKCLETLNIILKKSSSNIIVNSILFNDGMNLTLGLCKTIVFSNDSSRQKCLGLAFCLLNSLYHHPGVKSTLIIDIIIMYMKQILHTESNKPVHDNRIIICIMDFLWEHIAKTNMANEFVTKNGIFLMLDIIHKFPVPVQLVTLGVLVDLCECESSIPYVLTWRNQGQTTIPLLIKLFKEENKRLFVKSGPSGQISDIKYPLMGKEQWIQTFCRCIEVNGNPVMADLFISCRPKVYALLQMLNERYTDEVEIIEERYQLYSEGLNPEDQVTMLLAENYLALKLGEAWVELKTELDRIPVTLIPVDYRMVSYLTDRYMKWSSYLQNFQNNILRNAYENELIKEQKLYNFLEEARLSQALDALKELRYFARCSERMFRLSKKFVQNNQIEISLASLIGDNPYPHRTYFSKIQVTPVFNHTVNVESNINKSTEEVVLIPVSPNVSNEECNIDMPEDLLQSPSELNCDS